MTPRFPCPSGLFEWERENSKEVLLSYQKRIQKTLGSIDPVPWGSLFFIIHFRLPETVRIPVGTCLPLSWAEVLRRGRWLLIYSNLLYPLIFFNFRPHYCGWQGTTISRRIVFYFGQAKSLQHGLDARKCWSEGWMDRETWEYAPHELHFSWRNRHCAVWVYRSCD